MRLSQGKHLTLSKTFGLQFKCGTIDRTHGTSCIRAAIIMQIQEWQVTKIVRRPRVIRNQRRRRREQRAVWMREEMWWVDVILGQGMVERDRSCCWRLRLGVVGVDLGWSRRP